MLWGRKALVIDPLSTAIRLKTRVFFREKRGILARKLSSTQPKICKHAVTLAIPLSRFSL